MGIWQAVYTLASERITAHGPLASPIPMMAPSPSRSTAISVSSSRGNTTIHPSAIAASIAFSTVPSPGSWDLRGGNPALKDGVDYGAHQFRTRKRSASAVVPMPV